MKAVVIAALALAVPAAFLLFVGWRLSRRPVCPTCYYPFHRCECRRCEHSWWPWRWTEDGWVKVCRVCGDPAYGGDGPEPVEPEQGVLTPRRD